jgi:hypothetical protein
LGASTGSSAGGFGGSAGGSTGGGTFGFLLWGLAIQERVFLTFDS